MRQPLPGRESVPTVALGYHPIVDYRFVHAGRARWLDAAGDEPSFWEFDPTQPRLRPDHLAVPRGIELRLRPPTKGDPLIAADTPWEHWIVDGAITLIRDGGRFRLWYEAAPPDLFDPASRASLPWRTSYGVVLCYAESDDGVVWRKPDLGLQAWRGADTNIVLGRELAGPGGLLGAGVFVDPTAGPDERYRAIFMGGVDEAATATWPPDEIDPMARPGDRPRGMFVASSPDGLRWRTDPEPALIYFSDTGNVMEWDPVLRRYVWYARGWAWGRRTIARAEIQDLRRWPLPSPLLASPPVGALTGDLYMISKTTYPGDPTTHLMFPAIYDRSRDITSLAAYSSADNIAWSVIPGELALETGDAGSDDAGAVFGAAGLVDLPGNRVGFPYVGYATEHKHRPGGPLGVIRWATWPRGQIAGLTAAADGEFWTPPLRLQGRRLHLNVATETGGNVRVEAQSAGWSAYDGYRLADSTPIEGDHFDAPVRWGERAVLPEAPAEGLVLRVQLRRATLFGFELH